MKVAIENGEADASMPVAAAPINDSEDATLYAVLQRLCALTDDNAFKEGK